MYRLENSNFSILDEKFSMLSRSQPNFGMGLDIKIVQCLPGESCVPANSKIFGNALGYVFITLILPTYLLASYGKYA